MPTPFFLTPDQKQRQREAALAAGRTDPQCNVPSLIPPLLIIECVSPAMSSTTSEPKRRWYAEFVVANYWILDPFKRTLKCLVLSGENYQDDVIGQDHQEIRPSLFPGLVLCTGEIMGEVVSPPTREGRILQVPGLRPAEDGWP